MPKPRLLWGLVQSSTMPCAQDSARIPSSCSRARAVSTHTCSLSMPRGWLQNFIVTAILVSYLMTAACSSPARSQLFQRFPGAPLDTILGGPGSGRGVVRLALRGGQMSSDDMERRSLTPPEEWGDEEEEGGAKWANLGKGRVGDEVERVGDAMGDDDGMQWGPDDMYRDGNEIGPDDPPPDKQEPTRVIDRGSLGGGPMHTSKEKRNVIEGGGSVFTTALDTWLNEPDVDELVNKEQQWYKGTTEELRNEIHEKYFELQQWHKEFGAKQQKTASRMILEGNTVGGLAELRKANVHAPERDKSLGTSEVAKTFLKVDPKMLEGAESESSGEQEGGLKMLMEEGTLGGQGEKDEDYLDKIDQVRTKYRGWTVEEMNAELDRLTEKANTIFVPSQVGSVREAIAAAREEGFKVAVAPGDYEWADRLLVGGARPDSDQQLHIRAGVPDSNDAIAASEVRMWGQWCLYSNTWGSVEGVTLVHQPSKRGSNSLFLSLGGTVAFPWIFWDSQMRCAGGIPVLEAQKAFMQFTGCTIGGLDDMVNNTAVYGVYQTEQSNCILQASTLGYNEVAAIRAIADAVAVVDRCNVESNGRGTMFCGSAKVLVRNTSFINNTHAAFDPVGGCDEDDPEALAVRCDCVVQGSSVDGVIWFNGFLPGGLYEKDNNFAPSRGEKKENELDAEVREFNSEVIFTGTDPLEDEERPRNGALMANTSHPQDDLIKVPGSGLCVEALQWMIDRNGCSAVQACYERVNNDQAMVPLLVVPNSSGFSVVNTSDNNRTICGWVRAEQHEIILCPSCSLRGRIRVGLFGPIRCTTCRAVFPRNDTSASVALKGVDKEIVKKLQEVTDFDALKMNPETHALVPMPGGKLALIERQTNKTWLKPGVNTSGTMSSALKGFFGGNSQPLNDEEKDVTSSTKSLRKGKYQRVKLGQQSWGRDVADMMSAGGAWTSDMRAKFASLINTRREEDVRDRYDNATRVRDADVESVEKQRKMGSGGLGGGKGYKSVWGKKETLTGEKAKVREGPEVPQEWMDKDENKQKFRVMCANSSTGDAVLDDVLRKEGVIMSAGPPVRGPSLVENPPPGLMKDLLGGLDVAKHRSAQPTTKTSYGELKATQSNAFAELKGKLLPEGPPLPPKPLQTPRTDANIKVNTPSVTFEKLKELQKARIDDVADQNMFGESEDDLMSDDTYKDPVVSSAAAAGAAAAAAAGSSGSSASLDSIKKIEEFRRRLAQGTEDANNDDVCSDGVSLLTDGGVRCEGATPMTKEQQMALDRYASRMSMVQDELDRQEKLQRAHERVQEEEEDPLTGGTYRKSAAPVGRQARTGGEGGEEYEAPNLQEADTHAEADDDDVELQRQLLKSMTGQIRDTEYFFRALVKGEDVACGRKDGDVGKELRARALELVNLKNEIDTQIPGWLEENMAESRALKKSAMALYKEIWVYCESGAFEQRAKIDTKGLVKRMQALGLDDLCSSSYE